MMRTNKGLVEYAKKQLNRNTVYMWGSFGQLVTNSFITQKAKQYPTWYTPERVNKFKGLINKNVYAFDCVGLIKGYLWEKKGYTPNEDKSANGMYRAAKVKGDIKTMPEKPGILVWMEGHMGIYVGNGLVIEATPKWKDGVQITKLSDRKWLGWCECPYITYEKDDDIEYYIANIQEKIGLEDKTIDYLRAYKYGEELIKKIAKGLR